MNIHTQHSPIIATGLKTILTSLSTTIFAEHPKLISFGWKQYIDSDEKFVTTIEKPDINYEDGEDIYTPEDLAMQEYIANKLKKLNPVALQLAFDESAEVTVDAALDITRNDYDINRINTFEL